MFALPARLPWPSVGAEGYGVVQAALLSAFRVLVYAGVQPPHFQMNRQDASSSAGVFFLMNGLMTMKPLQKV